MAVFSTVPLIPFRAVPPNSAPLADPSPSGAVKVAPIAFKTYGGFGLFCFIAAALLSVARKTFAKNIQVRWKLQYLL